MESYKLIKIYADEDIEKIESILNVKPIEIKKNIMAIKYGLSLPYFLINNFILKENMDHVILYSNIFLSFIRFVLENDTFSLLEIKLLEMQKEIEELLNEYISAEQEDVFISLLEKYIPQKNIDIQFIKIKNTESQEIIIYNNGVITIMENNKFESIKGMLCSGI